MQERMALRGLLLVAVRHQLDSRFDEARLVDIVFEYIGTVR
jgi:hypothetical protein